MNRKRKLDRRRTLLSVPQLAADPAEVSSPVFARDMRIVAGLFLPGSGVLRPVDLRAAMRPCRYTLDKTRLSSTMA